MKEQERVANWLRAGDKGSACLNLSVISSGNKKKNIEEIILLLSPSFSSSLTLG